MKAHKLRKLASLGRDKATAGHHDLLDAQQIVENMTLYRLETAFERFPAREVKQINTCQFGFRSGFCAYADDILLWCEGTTQEEVDRKLKHALTFIETWLLDNGMSLAEDKDGLVYFKDRMTKRLLGVPELTPLISSYWNKLINRGTVFKSVDSGSATLDLCKLLASRTK
ncbi:hypothetical protein Pmar_PMAR022234 [Perkinsus marinus ATCC 50983]|uniref:Reverse transcriptase domain-containing protein n=1 Tax=Perkinsus marinus (strain ATCC 50983 / TXsc) TaxID=423536 RepID=C5KDJ5_PERM5|nr:hypothetical protein Pmar_PMAR022234 [Perkinsus marinus ATCC 50983]EER17298.1 hypothetical protein Pmar_PMAR022234 [Perkinsus marinus ATCC 50983]|eukprot:XP_002785502.1 hypothetical protein Pmar_PMAR022234 [Perkinsus marinus ATCC 50983]